MKTLKRKQTVRMGPLQQWFAQPDSWCQRNFAKDANGYPTCPRSKKTVKLCLLGAVDRMYRGKTDQYVVLSKLHYALPFCTGLASWNDAKRRTIRDIRELVKKAGV